MDQEFFFQLQTQMYAGIGFSRTLATFLKERAFKKVAVLVDEGVARKSEYFNEIMEIIRADFPDIAITQLRGTEEPDYDYLDTQVARLRALDRPDVLIGIGGGSCLDITKAVAVLLTNPGYGIEYRGFDKVMVAGVPTILIPTTAGTGSEATINAVFIDKKEKRKLGINGRFLNATYAILDAEWTLSCPFFFAVSAGIDALTHTLESFICKKANSVTRMFSKEAFRCLYTALPFLVDDPSNRLMRQQLLIGSYFAGAALFNSGSGIAGAFSYPIGVHFKVPHGIGGGVFLASVTEYNVGKGYYGYAQLFDLVETDAGLSAEAKSKEFAKKIGALTAKLTVPVFLNQWGVTRKNIDDVASLLKPLQAAFDQNPVYFSSDKDAYELLKKHVSV